MPQVNRDTLRALMAEQEGPCLSLYQPTNRAIPEKQQDPIRFRNLLKELEASLKREFPGREVQSLLEPFRKLAGDSAFWNHARDGLAVFGNSKGIQTYKVQRPVPELAIAATSFHVKPLIRIVQTADRYQILGLSRHEARLFQANRDTVDEIEPAPEVPRKYGDIPAGVEDEAPRPVSSHQSVGSEGHTFYPGHGSSIDFSDKEAERFFRAVDRAVLEHHSRPSGLPLILAALPEHHDLFRKVSHNPFLAPEGLPFEPKSPPDDQLRQAAWKLMEPIFHDELSKVVNDFNEARSKNLSSADVVDVARAVIAGRVGALLVEADRQVPGKLDPATGQVEFSDLGDPRVDDILDDLAERVLKAGGDVIVAPARLMPEPSGLAAVYRF